LHGHLPVALVRAERGGMGERMAATIRHNRARGVHAVLPMTDIVAALIRQGWSDERVAHELGMDEDEVRRFKQVSGLPELFRDHPYSKSWE
jgi:ParB-like chromosome segregation protein Spo0J